MALSDSTYRVFTVTSNLNFTRKRQLYNLYLTVLLLLFGTPRTSAELASITRTSVGPDLFRIARRLNASCPSNACSVSHGGVQQLSYAMPMDPCLCQCPEPYSTYFSKLGKCSLGSQVLSDREIRCNTFLEEAGDAEVLVTLDLYTGRQSLLINYTKPCSSITITWSYYKNNTWVKSMQPVFRLRRRGRRRRKIRRFLQVLKAPTEDVRGLLVKVHLTCSHFTGDTENDCLLVKVKGTYNLPVTAPTKGPIRTPVTTTTTSTPITTQPSTTVSMPALSTFYVQTTLPQTSQQPNTFGHVPPTDVEHKSTSTADPITTAREGTPGADTSQGEGTSVWIAVTAGVVTVAIVLVIGITLFCLLKRRKKQSKKGRMRRGHAGDDENMPMHEYEYVQYPGLAARLAHNEQQQPLYHYADCNVTGNPGNPMYEIGPDNQLIIKTPGVSMTSLASKSNISANGSSHGDINPSAPAWIDSYHKYKQSSHSTLDSNDDYVGRISNHESIPATTGEYQISTDAATDESGYAMLRGKTESKKNRHGYQTLVRPEEKVDQSGYVDMTTLNESKAPTAREQSAVYEDMNSQEDTEGEGDSGNEYLTVLPNSPVGEGGSGNEYLTVQPNSPVGSSAVGEQEGPNTPDYFVLEGPGQSPDDKDKIIRA